MGSIELVKFCVLNPMFAAFTTVTTPTNRIAGFMMFALWPGEFI